MNRYKRFLVVFPNEKIRDLFNGIISQEELESVDNPFEINKNDL